MNNDETGTGADADASSLSLSLSLSLFLAITRHYSSVFVTAAELGRVWTVWRSGPLRVSYRGQPRANSRRYRDIRFFSSGYQARAGHYCRRRRRRRPGDELGECEREFRIVHARQRQPALATLRATVCVLTVYKIRAL